MALINFKDIDFNQSINKETKVIDFNGSKIQVVNHLSSQDKYDLIMITVQKAKDKHLYNPFLIDLYFNLGVIYLYTNIIFDAEDRADEAGLYDMLLHSGLIEAVLKCIDPAELSQLKGYVTAIAKENCDYGKTIRGGLEELLEKLPKDLGAITEVLQNVSPELIQKITAATNASID